MYWCEKFDAFLPREELKRCECLSWMFWLASSASLFGGGFGHFYQYAPVKIRYAINMDSLEIKRQFDVSNSRLSEGEYLRGCGYTIAGLAIWPRYGAIFLENFYAAAEFLDIDAYAHSKMWAHKLGEREAVDRVRKVNRIWGSVERSSA